MDDKTDLNIHIMPQGKNTDTLTCNYCGEPHAVDPEYKQMILERGKERLKESGITDIKPEETWTCGKCFLKLQKIPDELARTVQTDCHEHHIPSERKYQFENEREEN